MAIVFNLNTEIRTIPSQPDAPADLPLDSLMVIAAVRTSEPVSTNPPNAVVSREGPSLTLNQDELDGITQEDAEWQ